MRNDVFQTHVPNHEMLSPGVHYVMVATLSTARVFQNSKNLIPLIVLQVFDKVLLIYFFNLT